MSLSLDKILNEEISTGKHSIAKQLNFLKNVIYVEKDIKKNRIVYDNLVRSMSTKKKM